MPVGSTINNSNEAYVSEHDHPVGYQTVGEQMAAKIELLYSDIKRFLAVERTLTPARVAEMCGLASPWIVRDARTMADVLATGLWRLGGRRCRLVPTGVPFLMTNGSPVPLFDNQDQQMAQIVDLQVFVEINKILAFRMRGDGIGVRLRHALARRSTDAACTGFEIRKNRVGGRRAVICAGSGSKHAIDPTGAEYAGRQRFGYNLR